MRCITTPRLYIYTYAALKIELAHDALQLPGERPPQRRRIQIVQNIERQQFGQIGKRLVADAIHQAAAAVGQQDLVDDVVADLQVLLDAQHKVPGAGAAVAHQKHAALAFRHQQIGGLLAGQQPKVPAGPIVHVERCAHYCCAQSECKKTAQRETPAPGAVVYWQATKYK